MATVKRQASGHWKAIVRRPRFGVRLKTKTFDRKEDALAWATEVEARIQRGVWRDTGDADKVTLREVVTRYQEAVGSTHRGSDVEESTWAVILSGPIAQHVVGSITRGEITALREKWRADGYAVGTINRRLGMLHSAFEWARDALTMPALGNPVPARTKLKGAVERSRRVSAAELDAIVVASASPVLADFVTLAVETAMRRGELCALTWAMIDSAAGVARLPADITKSERARGVPLSLAAAGVLERLRSGLGDEAASTDTVLGVRPHSITRAFERAVARARIAYVARCTERAEEPDPRFLVDIHVHDLRHEATSRLAALFGLHDLMKIVGHSSSKMLNRYYHPDAADFTATLRAAERKGGPQARVKR